MVKRKDGILWKKLRILLMEIIFKFMRKIAKSEMSQRIMLKIKK